MAKLKIAHIKEENRDLVIIPLDCSFNDKSPVQRTKILQAIKECIAAAGIDAPVAVAWRAGSNQYFIAPEPWHDFLRTLSWNQIIAKLCRVVTCDYGPAPHRYQHERRSPGLSHRRIP